MTNRKKQLIWVVVIALLWLFFRDGGPFERMRVEGANHRAAIAGEAALMAAEKEKDRAEMAAARAADDAREKCYCAAGAVCEGPQGGRYCMTDGGKKRYMKSQP